MHVVPFLRCFVENPDAQNRYHAKIDKDLENKLLEELPGILKWIVEGARLYMEHGLKAPACVKNAVEEYRSSRDQISDFMYECCEQGDRFKIRATNLVKAFNGWRKDQGQSRPMSAAVVTERLERKGIIKGKSNITVYKGLKLNDEGEEYLKPTNERKTGFVFEILLRQALWLHLRYPIHLILTR
jgi:phage/plasmid-associated DNA primase